MTDENDMPLYYVLDSRAYSLSMENGRNPDMNGLDEDWERMVMEAGTIHECCDACNNATYGTKCVVTDENGIIQWKNFRSGAWVIIYE